jgi:uncharacterized membrane protein YcaP (DUF421 family)
MVETTYWFGGWDAIARIVVITTGGYIAMILVLRVGGWRRLTKMRLYDFIIAVTIGSAFGRMLTAREVGVVDAFVVFSVLVGLQHRSTHFARLVTPDPVLVYYRGTMMADSMKRARVREAELLQAARERGFGALNELEAVVLEPDGEFSVIATSKVGDGSAVRKVASGDGS